MRGSNPMYRPIPTVVMSADPPVIVSGRPTTPAHQAVAPSSASATQGLTSIRNILNLSTVTSLGGHLVTPPTPLSGTWAARWTAQTLPDPAPYPSGYYWLGDPASEDGSNAYTDAATHAWAPTPDGSGAAPSWRSAYPYKPAVTGVDHFLPSGATISHPKGVVFDSHYIDHMWLDFGADQGQPFTWVIVAMMVSWPDTNYTHYLLDAGRDPSAVGFPRLEPEDVDSRLVADGLPYRSTLAVSPSQIRACSKAGDLATNASLRLSTDAALRPRMYVACFNGSLSYLAAWSPGKRALQRGQLVNGTDQKHRYYVMGRSTNVIDNAKAASMLVFEMRYWRRALSPLLLMEQYEQLSTVWHFDQYRGL